MAGDQPLVSILMNCYNGAALLAPAIESVLAQTYRHWEIIFWDNQSTDASADICRSYGDPRIKYFYADHHTNLGGARAAAFEQVTGELTAVLDTDDLWEPAKLERQVPLFRDADVGIAISDTLFFSGDGRRRQLFGSSHPPEGYVFEQLATAYFVSLETVVLRTAAVRGLPHGFDSRFSHVSDMDLILRLSQTWKLAFVPEVLAKWRVHQASGTSLEPERFFNERRAFVEKMDALPEYAERWRAVRPRFVERTYVMHAVRLFANRKPGDARRALAACPVRGRLWTAVAAASCLPFGGAVIGHYHRRRQLVA